MKKLLVLAALALILLMSLGCTSNQRAKDYGGTMTIDLPVGQKLVNASWKNSDLWYLTRLRREGEQQEVFTFKEDSSYGVMQGTVIFKEH